MAGRKPRPGAGGQRPRKPARAGPVPDDKDAEVARLSAALAEAEAKLAAVEAGGIDAFTTRKIEQLLEAAQIARGQAFDASLARNKAEGELRALQKAIAEVGGPMGWLLRRALRRLPAKP